MATSQLSCKRVALLLAPQAAFFVVVAVFLGGFPLPLFVLWIGICVAWVATAALSSERIDRRTVGGVRTGRTVTAVHSSATRGRWYGGANLTADVGRRTVTAPAAVLRVGDGFMSLTVEGLAGRGARMFGMKSLGRVVGPELLAYPIVMQRVIRGVGIEPAGEPPAYFWTGTFGSQSERDEILAVLAAAGCTVSWEVRRASSF